ncbi:hypothetical protein K435DRAFT_801412 [Dendrothele bispora CBS 962.96]|uniref:Uncharacterized protein n=1 Tax=Dendrothele bispora (strain CBS 962.96) TaxID=1314807 RepID=A0A4S8LPF5_DENBC|nr:hypothetical protein K435DRAFT_801412 [Dendrothele bispora CBS 962.96]
MLNPSRYTQAVDRPMTALSEQQEAYYQLQVILQPRKLAPPALLFLFLIHLFLIWVRTAHDMVLPDASAFYDSSLKQDIYQYPPFTLESGAFTWQSMFKLVKRPVVLWNVYKPKNIGEYGTVKALWDVWDSGATIEAIGRCPPLRFIDESWGSRKDKNGTGKFPLWRPKNDTTARKTWSNFEFFIKKIKERKDSSGGKSISEIIDEFEVLRGDDGNLNPLHKRLQAPRKKKDSPAPPQ